MNERKDVYAYMEKKRESYVETKPSYSDQRGWRLGFLISDCGL